MHPVLFAFHIWALLGQTIPGDHMKYRDPKMEQYWNSLSPSVQNLIAGTGIDISSLGMLTKLGEYYQNDSSLSESQQNSIS